jgi:hypothetical protein
MGFSWFWHLSINADSTFTLEAFEHTSPRSQYAGKVVVENYRFRLITSDKDFYEPSVFIPVKWGQRRYLINVDSVDSFCNYISQGWEPRDWETGGPFYLKENHWEKPAGLFPMSLNGFSLCTLSSIFKQ